MLLLSSLTSPMPKVCVGRLTLPFFSSHSVVSSMIVDGDDKGTRSHFFLSLPKPYNAVALSSNAPILLGFTNGTSKCETHFTKSKSGGLPGGFPQDNDASWFILPCLSYRINISLLPQCKLITDLCVEVP